MLTVLSALSPLAHAGFVSDNMDAFLAFGQQEEFRYKEKTVAALKLENDYRAYETHEDSPLPSLKIETDIILSAPVIKGLMTFFTAKENSTKTSLIHARDSFVKAVLAIALLKSAQHLKNVNLQEASKIETAQHLAVSVIRAVAAFSYICGQTDTGFGDVYRALKEHGVRGLLTDKNLSVENMLRQTANILLPLLRHSNVKTFVQTQCQPKEIERAAIKEARFHKEIERAAIKEARFHKDQVLLKIQ